MFTLRCDKEMADEPRCEDFFLEPDSDLTTFAYLKMLTHNVHMNGLFPARDYKSHYLCSSCGGLLYSYLDDLSTQLCINATCKRSDQVFTILDTSLKASPQLHKELHYEETNLLELIRSCDRKDLIYYVYNRRLELINTAVTTGVMPSIPMWHSIGDLLILINTHMPQGSDHNRATFDSIVQMSYRRSEHLNFIEDVENGRYKIVLLPDGKYQVIVMKYLKPIIDMYKAYGIVSSGNIVDESELFKFQDIDELVFCYGNYPQDGTFISFS